MRGGLSAKCTDRYLLIVFSRTISKTTSTIIGIATETTVLIILFICISLSAARWQRLPFKQRITNQCGAVAAKAETAPVCQPSSGSAISGFIKGMKTFPRDTIINANRNHTFNCHDCYLSNALSDDANHGRKNIGLFEGLAKCSFSMIAHINLTFPAVSGIRRQI